MVEGLARHGGQDTFAAVFPFYQYDIGNLVTLRGGRRICTVVWRGYLLVGEAPYRGRVAVYRLDNGYWDLYYPDEIRSASQSWYD